MCALYCVQYIYTARALFSFFFSHCLLEFESVLSLSAGDCISNSCAFSSFFFSHCFRFFGTSFQIKKRHICIHIYTIPSYRREKSTRCVFSCCMPNSTFDTITIELQFFESIFTFAVVYIIFSAECSLKSACSSNSIDCVKQSLSCTTNSARTY